MFSERLENLIKACIQDGVLTDQEKQAILKRAESEGEDINEVDIYIQSLMQKADQERKLKEDEKDKQIEKERKKELGRVCPKCGKYVPPLTIKCECGFEFHEIQKGKTSAQDLSDKIDVILSSPIDMDPSKRDDSIKLRESKICDTISIHPVPNTKEDIVDFLSLTLSHSKIRGGFLFGTVLGRLCVVTIISLIILLIGLITSPRDLEDFLYGAGFTLALGGGWIVFLSIAIPDNLLIMNRRAKVWREKFREVMLKGRSLRGDLEFQKQLDFFENKFKKI